MESAIIVKTTIFIIKATQMYAWLRSDEAIKIADKAKIKAWNYLEVRYPNTDLRKLVRKCRSMIKDRQQLKNT